MTAFSQSHLTYGVKVVALCIRDTRDCNKTPQICRLVCLLHPSTHNMMRAQMRKKLTWTTILRIMRLRTRHIIHGFAGFSYFNSSYILTTKIFDDFYCKTFVNNKSAAEIIIADDVVLERWFDGEEQDVGRDDVIVTMATACLWPGCLLSTVFSDVQLKTSSTAALHRQDTPQTTTTHWQVSLSRDRYTLCLKKTSHH